MTNLVKKRLQGVPGSELTSSKADKIEANRTTVEPRGVGRMSDQNVIGAAVRRAERADPVRSRECASLLLMLRQRPTVAGHKIRATDHHPGTVEGQRECREMEIRDHGAKNRLHRFLGRRQIGTAVARGVGPVEMDQTIVGEVAGLQAERKISEVVGERTNGEIWAGRQGRETISLLLRHLRLRLAESVGMKKHRLTSRRGDAVDGSLGLENSCHSCNEN
jgi:hypothetical protein